MKLFHLWPYTIISIYKIIKCSKRSVFDLIVDVILLWEHVMYNSWWCKQLCWRKYIRKKLKKIHIFLFLLFSSVGTETCALNCLIYFFFSINPWLSVHTSGDFAHDFWICSFFLFLFVMFVTKQQLNWKHYQKQMHYL